MGLFPEWAAKHIGLEYADRGRGPKYYDCWGLVLRVLHMERGLVLPDYSDRYSTSIRDPLVSDAFEAEAVNTKRYAEVARQDAAAFDIVVFNMAGRPTHCGVVLTPNHFLHIHAGTGSCLDGLNSPRWSSRVSGVYRAL